MAVRRRDTPEIAASSQHSVAMAAPTAPDTSSETENHVTPHEVGARDHDGGMMPLPIALLTALYTHLPNGVIVVDTAGQIMFMNEAATRLNAALVLAAQGAALSDPTSAMSLIPHEALIARVLAGHSVPDVDHVLGLQGETGHCVVQVAIMALRGDSDQITGAVLTLTDQTKRVDEQIALVRVADGLAQALARTAVTLAKEAKTQARDNRKLARSNTALERRAALARVADTLAQDAREALARTAITLAEVAVIQAQDNQDLTRSNTELEVKAVLARVADALAKDAREALARTAVTLAEEAVAQAQDNRDLTRSNAEGEERFRLLVSSVRDCALFMLDPQGQVISWNEGAQRIKQYAAAEIIGRHVSIFFTPEDQAQGLPAQSLHLAATDGHYEAEGWRVRKDGSRFWAEVHITAIFDNQQHLIGFGNVTRDLTEPRQAEEEIRTLNTNLEQRVTARTADLAMANTQLTAINNELEAFAYSVSHDLRTPLRAISGFGEILMSSYGSLLNSRGLHYLQRIRNATEHMSQLINDLLALSRLTRADMRLGPVDLTALARTVAAALQEAEPERAVTWEIADGLTAHGDMALLRVALDNLLGNAWKFTSPHPTAHIVVDTLQDDGETIYIVRDDGAGFDMAYADKLFGAFQRLHTVQEFAGTGIGLATVQRIIHRHGGRIWAQGIVGQGATISFTLSAPEGD